MPEGAVIVVGYLIALFAIAAGFLYLRSRTNVLADSGEKEEEGKANEPKRNPPKAAKAAGGGKKKGGLAARMKRMKTATETKTDGEPGVQEDDPDADLKDPEEKSDDENLYEVDEDDLDEHGNLTKDAQKRIKKHNAKIAKADDRKALDQRRDKKQAANEARYEAQRLKEEAREAEERRLREEAERKRLEKEKKEASEFDDWKSMFEVDEEGHDGRDDDEDNTELLAEFITYITSHKVVVLDELASHFRLKTSEVVDRIKELEVDNRISGILDDRGKYIYISQEEMESVVSFIKQKGRVNITEVVKHCNQHIKLAGEPVTAPPSVASDLSPDAGKGQETTSA
mmetsp:Transcript_49874/g.97803  ORF Transcript_49874/g.97803 Transcript_49874/m.97803 type:complete len:342 (+) Transcript_49874:20-1045(+)|eukprot:CAMPEP_0175143882 /NCGR_PEP_ID=MMETSP0087-20121206/13763_1 /TAXON_ID=136419 /ORGANISM="Unknown Unknown, Strain D1" /LENGTH=341 /DNA_ID=CAMNT_0016428169 /DNA_START=16 /DNA_END=1041 /DNA_ORIENTATION=+